MANDEGFDNFRVIWSHRSDNNESKKKIREEEQEIVCKYAEQKRVFLSHTGTLLPCCFFNSEFLQCIQVEAMRLDILKNIKS